MAKNNVIEHEVEEDFDFSDILDMSEEAEMANMMEFLVAANNHQMNIALELTKLIVEKSPSTMDAEAILSAFKHASKHVVESSPLREVFEKLYS